MDKLEIQEAVELLPEFVEDMPKLSKGAMKLGILFRLLRQSSSEKYKGTYAWVRVGYPSIRKYTGMKSNTSIKKAMKELALLGWLEDFKRGGFQMRKGKRVNITNSYKVTDYRVPPPYDLIIAKLEGDVDTINKLTTAPEYVDGDSVADTFDELFEEDEDEI